MSDDKKTLKFQMMMSPGEATELDDWMFQNRIRSRAEAIRRLWQAGLLLDELAPRIVEALKKLEAANDGPEADRDIHDYENGTRALYRALGPLLIGRLGIQTMSDMDLEVKSSPMVAALYEAANEYGKAKDKAGD